MPNIKEIVVVTSLTIGARYPAGVYNVIVSQAAEVRTLRLIER